VNVYCVCVCDCVLYFCSVYVCAACLCIAVDLTCLFHTYVLALCGLTLQSLSCGALFHTEVAFKKVLCRIWHLPTQRHTAIVHSVANLDNLLNLVYQCSNTLLFAACKCSLHAHTYNLPSVLLFFLLSCGHIYFF